MSYVRASGPAPSRVMIVAEYPTENDVTKGLVLSDWTGSTFNDMLKDAGI